MSGCAGRLAMMEAARRSKIGSILGAQRQIISRLDFNSDRPTRGVPGHEYGLDLDENDRRALIAFLRTL